MKKSVRFLFIVVSTIALAQSPKSQKVKYVTINQKICSTQKGFQLVLKQVLGDSRCPEGVTCVWAGEVTVVVSVYKDSKLIENNTMVFSIKKEQENIKWLASYLPEKHKNIKSISVFPYPKSGSTISPKDYYIKIAYSK